MTAYRDRMLNGDYAPKQTPQAAKAKTSNTPKPKAKRTRTSRSSF